MDSSTRRFQLPPESDFKDPASLGILVVDDDTDVRAFVTTVLRTTGYRVVDCRNGMEAIKLIEQSATPFDLVVADVVMPHLGGRQLASRLGELQPHARVLLISGYPSLSSVLNQIANHAEATDLDYHFLAKPFTPKDLIREVRRILSIPAGSGLRGTDNPIDLEETQLLSH